MPAFRASILGYSAFRRMATCLLLVLGLAAALLAVVG